jgi:hypothetical protein
VKIGNFGTDKLLRELYPRLQIISKRRLKKGKRKVSLLTTVSLCQKKLVTIASKYLYLRLNKLPHILRGR